MFKGEILELDDFSFVKQTDELVSPSLTSIEGVFVAGAASGPKDIPDSILSAGCAASEVAGYLNRKETLLEDKKRPFKVMERSAMRKSILQN